jgi:glutamate carboxypeptidase
MDAALVLEGARANGNIVSARKGSGQYTLRVKGKSAHAGVEPEKGANAILELSHQIIALHQLNGIAPGVTVNAGVIGGGTRSNVVPDEAWAKLDMRAVDRVGAEAIDRAIRETIRHITVAGTSVEIEGSMAFTPMAKTPAVALLVQFAQEVAHELGFEVQDQSTGGASDANTITSFGIPVLDGLGPIGGLDHSPNEYIELDSIVPRTALVAGLIQRICAEREQLKQLHSA